MKDKCIVKNFDPTTFNYYLVTKPCKPKPRCR